MRLVIVLLITGFLVSNAFAISPQQKKVGDTVIEVGEGTDNILPLLENIANTYGKYLKQIYGQNRWGNIIIILQANEGILSPKEAEKLTIDICNYVIRLYPHSGGRIEMNPNKKAKLWDLVWLEFERGTITKKDIFPKELILEKRVEALNEPSLNKFGLSEKQRREYYIKYWDVKDRARREAEKRYPNDIAKSYEFESNLTDEYRKKLLQEYNLTNEQAKEIFQEGFINNWYLDK